MERGGDGVSASGPVYGDASAYSGSGGGAGGSRSDASAYRRIVVAGGGGEGRAIGVPAYRRTSVFAPLCMHAVPVEFPVLLYVQGSVGVLVQFGTSALSG